MNRSIGVDIDDFRLPSKDALKKAAELEFRVIEWGAGGGELSPGQLSGSGRRHLARLVSGLGMTTAAITADPPGLRLTDARAVEERIARTCQIIDMAAELDVPVVTASLGAVINPETSELSSIAVEALRRIGEWADSRGRVYALRPSGEGDKGLGRLLNELRCPAIQIGIDPAAMVMAGVNPLALIERFAGQIAVAYLRDGTVGLPERGGRETLLGEGDVDLVTLWEALRDSEYAGPQILRRLESQTPTSDIIEARAFLQRTQRFC